MAMSARYVARLVRKIANHAEPIRLDPSIKDALPLDPFEHPDF